MPEQRPSGEITVWREGFWRPWRWSFTELRYGREDRVLRSLPIEGRSWTEGDAFAAARLCQLLREEGRRREAS